MAKGNLYFIGFMGVGKSTIARMTAKSVNGQLIEMDEMLEAEEGISINEIFATKGEAYFRDLETALIERIAEQDGMIVSCGGGAVLRPQNLELMKKSGKIVYLSATPETIFKRVRYSTNRPLLQGNMNIEYIAGLMEKRIHIYEAAADHIIATDGKEKSQIAGEILGIY
jgi:shikimate kinase